MSGRYDGCDKLRMTEPDGTTVTYLALRILPFGWTVAGPDAAVVRAGEEQRPDLFAYRTLKNPMLAFRIADANDAMDPMALCDYPGRLLQLPSQVL